MHLPPNFIQQTQPLLAAEWPAFERALHDEPPVSIRWNPHKRPETPAFPCGEAVPWAADACYLDSRPSFTLDPYFHAGCYYVQEASSMYLESLLRPHIQQSMRTLDLCAAPGGKATHLLSFLPEGSLLVANEAIRARAAILVENLIKWGNSAAFVTQNDPAAIGRLTAHFDLLVADLPCSGEGLFRKDPLASRQWSPAHVRLCADRQKRILAAAWPALRPDGLLVYSTCTYNRTENEDNLDWISRHLGAELLADPHRFFPHRTRGEGFFIALLRKNGTNGAAAPRVQSAKINGASRARFSGGEENYLRHPDRFAPVAEAGHTFAVPVDFMDQYLFLRQRLSVLSGGVDLGQRKGSDWIPSHALALSNELNPKAFSHWEMSREEALHYLRKEALPNPPENLPLGYLLVTYNHHPLGFVKNIGSRANNLYPADYRIRKQL
jgi:16S rRNA C967 or C1407 C5-methylase (RsmB/RsmF family)/NOL1/NOP2/fmu family ribosome biogenesis protein